MAREATLTRAKRAGTHSRRALRVALGVLALVLGLGCLVLGGAVFASAHNTHPIEIDGIVADYHEITINGAYARNELRLANDPRTYTFDSRQFHPALPQRFQKDTRIQIWVDEGTTNVLAITLYDEMGINPTNYSTSAYDNPTLAFVTTESEAGALAVMGIALLIAGGLSLLIRRKRWPAAQSERARGLSQPAPVAFGPAGAVASQPYQPQHLPAIPAEVAPATPSANGAVAIPLSQAAPTTPAPNRPPRPTSDVDLDQLPTQKSPAMPPAVPPASIPPASAALPGAQAAPRPVQPSNTDRDAAASPFAAWGIAPQPQDITAQSPMVRPPALQPVIPPEVAHPQASAPPGSLPDFPTEHLPSATATGAPPPGDLSDEPTRKSETVAPPNAGNE